jgi:hypothetical protein
MPLKPHPTDPEKMVYVSRQYEIPQSYRYVKTVHECKPVYVAQQDEDDDTQGFMPDWANFEEGRKVGRAEALERISDKVKEMPLETDTKDSFLVWLEEQK